ncbi:MAG: phnD [Frondihabitans sp.]|nr:phnD [Frondihabitans sp.]
MRSSRTTIGTLAAAAVIAAVALSGCSSSASGSTPASTAASSQGTWAQAKGTLVFAAVPDQSGSDTDNKPLEDYIAKETGYKVEYYPTTDYTALIAAAVAGKVDLMSSGALQYVEAVNKGAKVKPVAATKSSPAVTDPGYYSDAIVPKGSSITSLADAKGKTVCFVDPSSTSGFLFGLYQLQKAGIDVKSTGTDANGNPTFKDFKPYFAGAHDKSEQAVASGQCAVGFAEDSVVTPAAAKGDVAVIGKAYVPGGPLSISTTLPASVQKKLSTVLEGATLDAIKNSGVALTPGFTATYFGAEKEDASYYKSINDLCTSIPAAQCAK